MSDDLILDVKRVSRDDGEYIVKCPHCKQIIGIEGDDLSEIRGEQYQHKRREIPRFDGSVRVLGCDGWMQVHSDAHYVAEL